MKKVLIFNSPPRAGKDTAVKYMVEKLGGVHCELKTPLHKMASSLLEMTLDNYLQFYERDKENLCININNLIGYELPNPFIKPDPYEQFFSIRQFYIHLSENVMKPTFGKAVFGQYAGKNLVDGWNIFSDGGFPEEIDALHNYAQDVLVVNIEKEGCNYDKDSRCKINGHFEIENNGTLEEYYRKLDILVNQLKNV